MKKMAQINNYQGYEIDTEGNVYSSKIGNKKLLKPQKVSQSKKKYLAVGLYNKDNRRNKQGQLVPKMLYVHRLVWEAFVGKIEDGLTIDHIDGNPHNNRLNNLQLISLRDNVNKFRREERGFLIRDKRDELIQDYIELGSFDKVAEKWGVGAHTIRRAVKNLTWLVQKKKRKETTYDLELNDDFTDFDLRNPQTREKLGLKSITEFKNKKDE